jgi:hypothetical protein
MASNCRTTRPHQFVGRIWRAMTGVLILHLISNTLVCSAYAASLLGQQATPECGGRRMLVARPGVSFDAAPACRETTFRYQGSIVPWIHAFVEIEYQGATNELRIDNSDVVPSHGAGVASLSLWYDVGDHEDELSLRSSSGQGSSQRSAGNAVTASRTVNHWASDLPFARSGTNSASYRIQSDVGPLDPGIERDLPSGEMTRLPATACGVDLGLCAPARSWGGGTQRQVGPSQMRFGAYALTASAFPHGVDMFGPTDRFADIVVDANYRFAFNAAGPTFETLSTHATLVHQLSQSRVRTGSVIIEISYVPGDRADHLIGLSNVRLSARYANRLRIDAAPARLNESNVQYLSLWAASQF